MRDAHGSCISTGMASNFLRKEQKEELETICSVFFFSYSRVFLSLSLSLSYPTTSSKERKREKRDVEEKKRRSSFLVREFFFAHTLANVEFRVRFSDVLDWTFFLSFFSVILVCFSFVFLLSFNEKKKEKETIEERRKENLVCHPHLPPPTYSFSIDRIFFSLTDRLMTSKRVFKP